ncbi:hypothetical protein CBS76997_1393 [Aspergillus niger]|nr:hypothetical protein CBS13152_2195 [Aspergillus niger]KAI3052076.1 hypothetical protein CBS76997_1393 [Aspergillus niger]
MATTTTTAATSPPSSNILAPIPLNLVPNHPTSTSLSAAPLHNHPYKKRKVSHSENLNVHNDVFAVSEEPQTISIRSQSASLSEDQDPYHHLTPITTLSRNAIPFSWIDFEPREHKVQNAGLQGWCNIFVGDIPVLENEHAGDTVLAVRVVGEAGVWMVERVKRGVYALMRLRGVGEGEVVVAAKASAGSAFPFSFSSGMEQRRGRKDVGEWWEVAKIEDPEPVVLGKRGRSVADVEVVFGHVFEETHARETQDEMLRSDEGSEGPVLLGVGEQSGDVTATAAAGEQDVEVTQSPQELLDGLREQYLQALYVSKTSVAYFAKGPLARCRAAFQSSDNESSKPAQLVEFYREAILTAKRMDHKYRETLPTTIQDLLLSVSDDEAAPPKRKRRSTKKKLGKNGLYPEEGDLIRKWWRDRALNDQGLPSEMSRDAESKKHIADLRLRETQLQILLILETMALETIIADEKKREGNGEGADKPTKTAKGKKPQDMNVMLELHLDRLCIWHAVSFEETVVADSAKTNHLSGKKVESDAVRDFCTEVIVPFYASRLPDKCKLITRKLGVSTAISPFTKQSQTKKTPREPGTPVERQHAQKSRRAFQRVLTDQAPSQTRQPPSLSRSNTTPAPTESRRESLDPLLPTVSANVRGGIQKAKRVENREVDLNAVARQHETKLKKMQMLVDQKKELDAAIHALRKPNRELVAKDIAEDASKRLSTGGGSSRKPKNPVRNPHGQGVQVAATPKGSRKKDAMADMPPLPKSLSQPALIPQGSSSSSPFTSEPQIVPGSNIRPSSNSGLFRSADDGAIQETPTRRPTQPLSSADIGASPKRKISGPLFRVPSKPAPAPTSVPAPVPPVFRTTEKGPTTPIAARHVDAYMPRVKSIGSSKPSMIMETPPKPAMAPIFSIPSAPVIAETAAAEPAAVAGTPVKGATTATTTTITTTPAKANVFATPVKGTSAARLAVPTTAAAAVPATPEKSIYAQLGWDDDDDDLA